VSLTGDGGDELFRGYRVFDNALALSILSNIPLNIFISFCIDLIGRYGGKNDSYIGAELMLRRARSVNSNRTINPLFGAIGPLGGTELFDLVCRRNDFSVSRREIAVTKKTIENFFIKEVLPKIYLAKSDRMSMSNGLELRSPLLDYRVIESAFGFSEINFYFKHVKDNFIKFHIYIYIYILIYLVDSFHSIFHLVQSTLWRPNCNISVILIAKHSILFKLYKRQMHENENR
jgi:asparagine synthase (glutamine-hydrolysing)